jgi:uncharacterized damage-inducible protein DinB
MTDDELLWTPTEDAWTLHPDSSHPGGWSYPYDFDPAPPHPVTSIGWRLVHITASNWIYMEHAFGPGERNFPDLAVHGTVPEVLDDWRSSRAPVTAWLQAASDTDLAEARPSHLGAPLAAGEVMRILIDEQTHHGAEVALLRDLYLRRR